MVFYFLSLNKCRLCGKSQMACFLFCLVSFVFCHGFFACCEVALFLLGAWALLLALLLILAGEPRTQPGEAPLAAARAVAILIGS